MPIHEVEPGIYQVPIAVPGPLGCRRSWRSLRGSGGLHEEAWDVSQELFGHYADPVQVRFVMAETLAHLEHLVGRERLDRSGEGHVRYRLADQGARLVSLRSGNRV